MIATKISKTVRVAALVTPNDYYTRVESLEQAKVTLSKDGEDFTPRHSTKPLYYANSLDGNDLHIPLDEQDRQVNKLLIIRVQHPDALDVAGLIELMGWS